MPKKKKRPRKNRTPRQGVPVLRKVTMEEAMRQPCMRCGRANDGREGWNGDWRQGVLLGLVCPDCQTPMENAEAEIKAATLDYVAGPNGEPMVRPKWKAVTFNSPEDVVNDLIRRADDSMRAVVGEIAAGSEGIEGGALIMRAIDHVESGLPEGYPEPKGGPGERRAMIDEIVRSMVDGSLYEDGRGWFDTGHDDGGED